MTVRDKTPMSDSQFHMWRCVIAIAHADGHISEEEQRYLDRAFESLDRVHGLTDAQRAAFDDDIRHAKKLGDLLPLVTEPEYRATLVQIGQMMAWADDELSEDEEHILKSLHAEQLAKVDLDRLRQDVRNRVEAEKTAHDMKMTALRQTGAARSPVLRAVDGFLGRLGFNIFD